MFNVPYGHMAVTRPEHHLQPAANNAALNADRLRRHGYADGERQPRKPKHWANR